MGHKGLLRKGSIALVGMGPIALLVNAPSSAGVTNILDFVFQYRNAMYLTRKVRSELNGRRRLGDMDNCLYKLTSF